MVKKLLSIFILCFIVKSLQAQNFSIKYNFASVTTTTGPVDPTPTQTVVGASTGSWTTVGTGTTPSGGGYFSFTGWGLGATNGDNTTFTGSIDPAKYYEITLTPSLGYSVTLKSMSFGVTRSGTGIRHFAVRTDRDSYAANVAATYTPLNSASTTTVIAIQGGNTFFWFDDAQNSSGPAAGSEKNNICAANFSGPNFTNQGNPYTLRIYAWDAESGIGTFRVDTLMINGIATFSAAGLMNISHDLNASFKLYPNPSTNEIVFIEPFNANKGTVELVNILGAVVLREEKENGMAKLKLDVSTLQAGTYFVRYLSGDKVLTEKLILSK